MGSRLVVISTCDECPYYNNQYYTYEQTCTKLDRFIPDGEIPDDCPLTPLGNRMDINE